jgi:hypothetical protein
MVLQEDTRHGTGEEEGRSEGERGSRRGGGLAQQKEGEERRQAEAPSSVSERLISGDREGQGTWICTKEQAGVVV